MITIYHLSDFHLTKEILGDWKKHTLPALTNIIKAANYNPRNTYIVCTGDLIDKGGKDFGGVTNALREFKTEVIDSLLALTRLDVSHFVIVPGNHDVDRYADEEHEPLGLRTLFKRDGYTAINKKAKILLDEGLLSGARRIDEYKEFEKELYSGQPNVICTKLGTSVVDRDIKVGFAALNTAWNVIDDNDFDDGLVLGEPQYDSCWEAIESSSIKVALCHHPLDWLKHEQKTIVPKLYSNYDIILMGHVHEKQTSLVSGWSGTALLNIAPSYSNDIRGGIQGAFANGFTKIEYDNVDRVVTCSYYTYSFSQSKYVLASEPEGGVWSREFPSQVDPTLKSTIERCIDSISSIQITNFNNSIIPQRANAIKTVKDSFVLPPIVKNGDHEGVTYTLSDILNNSNSQLLFGGHESGKSIVLFRLTQELLENYHQYGLIPAYMDFLEIGSRSIEQVVKDFCDCNSKELKSLEASKKIILLVDNYTPSAEYRYVAQKLYRYCTDNKIRVIATSTSELSTVPQSFIDGNQIPFEFYFIQQFKAGNIKALMARWSPEDVRDKRNEKLENLVSRFYSYGLPCTAMSVSLYLWSTENAGKEPINEAYLLDIYMDIILDKMDTEGIYRNTFDYDNKINLLASISQTIFQDFEENKTITLQYDVFVGHIRKYLEKVGFSQYKADDLADYFIKQRVFNRTNNDISYAHSCFFYFLLAKRMIANDAFCEYILDESRYFKYSRIIDYYSGLKRSDESLLKTLLDRVNTVFEKVQGVYDEVDFDDCFSRIRVGQTSYLPIADKVDVKKVVVNRPDNNSIDNQLLKVCDQKISRISDEFSSSDKIDPLELIVLLSTALRNLDSIENIELKFNTYRTIVRDSLIYTVILKDVLAKYANEHDYKLPPAFSSVKNVDSFFIYMPYSLQWSLSRILCTTKLKVVFEKKKAEDIKNNVSNVEEYFTQSMLLDATGMENAGALKKFIRKVGKNAVRDYLLQKLVYKYYRLPQESEQNSDYVDLIASVKVKSERFPLLQKGKLLKEIEKEKKSAQVKMLLE